MVQAPGEAEAAAAALNTVGLADAVASQDSDALLFGAEEVLHGLRITVRASVCECVRLRVCT